MPWRNRATWELCGVQTFENPVHHKYSIVGVFCRLPWILIWLFHAMFCFCRACICSSILSFFRIYPYPSSRWAVDGAFVAILFIDLLFKKHVTNCSHCCSIFVRVSRCFDRSHFVAVRVFIVTWICLHCFLVLHVLLCASKLRNIIAFSQQHDTLHPLPHVCF